MRRSQRSPPTGSPAPSTPSPTPPMTEPWWKTAVVYQIYPRSFRDTTGDGVGDLRGIIDGLDHLEWLGVDALWLSPVFRSPMVDHGYDVSDYCDIDPVFGSLADMDELIERPPTRAQGAARLGAQPHQRPAPVVPRVAVVARRPEAGLVRVARRVAGRAPQRLAPRLPARRAGVVVGRGDAGMVPPPVRAGAARPELGPPRPAGRDARHAAVLARPGHRRVPDGRRCT